ncbi:hypothetical protein BOV94_10200 [Solemya velum gill symbiont]|uniref:Uncharacterized protein n=2 Tax=Solemya velum gill symbiont TaxID=2340 RepID=A0A0B0H344_SOVGS|nr:hypothetical protein [Solemya velum gill symbiont]KHF24638.1 hypothetical protein JV46_10590 [Solemya velum gill symbiont]OOY49572.1 hypothetical protein BOV94_10200 [Solemya velum gill symbiont]OOY98173.1 hypothetical protein BOW19_10180 [Solemya velum gill symbiont]
MPPGSQLMLLAVTLIAPAPLPTQSRDFHILAVSDFGRHAKQLHNFPPLFSMWFDAPEEVKRDIVRHFMRNSRVEIHFKACREKVGIKS